MRLPKIKVGDRFGRLEVIARAARKPGCRNSRWTCRCACGTVKEYRSYTLSGAPKHRAQSCGCWRRDEIRLRHLMHGQSRTRAYQTWRNMIKRCTDQGYECYHRYGGRGITVCDRWFAFEAFLEDMGQPPPGMTIDRKDNNGPYAPDNCRWATMVEQNRNKRNNHLLTIDGVTRPLAAWAEQSGLKAHTIRGRLKRGYTDAAAVGLPIHMGRPRATVQP